MTEKVIVLLVGLLEIRNNYTETMYNNRRKISGSIGNILQPVLSNKAEVINTLHLSSIISECLSMTNVTIY